MSRIFVADDHPLIQSAIQSLLRQAGHEIVGSAGTVNDARAEVPHSAADLLLLDLQMPDGSGLHVMSSLRARRRKVAVLLYTAGVSDETIREALALGVRGILLKTSDPSLVNKAVEAIAAGGTWFDPAVKARVDAISVGGGRRALTERERSLIQLVGAGLKNREIAEHLKTTEGTVKAYLHALYDKVGVENRTELAMKAADLT